MSVLNVCKNYNTIVNCEFLDDDLFSKKLVEYYKKAVERSNNDEASINKMVKIDRTLRKYIEDYNFSLKLKNSVDVSSILKSELDLTDMVLEYAVNFLDKYDDDVEKPVVNTRWI